MHKLKTYWFYPAVILAVGVLMLNSKTIIVKPNPNPNGNEYVAETYSISGKLVKTQKCESKDLESCHD